MPARGEVGGRSRFARDRSCRRVGGEVWEAETVPCGTRLWLHGRSGVAPGPATLTFDVPPAEARGVTLRMRGGYLWEPVAALVTVPAPEAGAAVRLEVPLRRFAAGRGASLR